MQIKSGPSDESGGPDSIIEQFITAVHQRSRGSKKHIKVGTKAHKAGTVRSTI